MANRTLLTVIQLNDSHAYFDLHQEMLWQGCRAVYRPAGGYARIATIVKQIRAENPGRTLFCDSGDTLHGSYSALKTQGEALIPVLNTLGLDAMTAHWEFAYGPETFKQRAAKLNYPMVAITVGLCGYVKRGLGFNRLHQDRESSWAAHPASFCR